MVAKAFETMPLDSGHDLQEAAGQALVKIVARAPAHSSPQVGCQARSRARAEHEIYLLATLPPQLATPELLKAWVRPLNTQESLAFAYACAVVADPRMVPAVSTLLDPRQCTFGTTPRSP